jgi:hypothetical protein
MLLYSPTNPALATIPLCTPATPVWERVWEDSRTAGKPSFINLFEKGLNIKQQTLSFSTVVAVKKLSHDTNPANHGLINYTDIKAFVGLS